MDKQTKVIKIVIIDSGVSEHRDINKDIKGVDIISFGDSYRAVPTTHKDSIGHGTAIAFLISHNLTNIEVFSVKIYDNDLCVPEKLIFALEYIFECIDCDVLNISLGVTSCSSIAKLRECCEKLISKGTVIVSAFDNNGTISYPAAFDSVIGVDSGMINGNIMDYIYVENSPINIIGCQREQRLPWIDNKYQIVSGASFIAPYITIRVARLLNNGYISLRDILEQLRKTACDVITCNLTEVTKLTMPNKAIVFPFNKEIHSLARYRQRAAFDIEGFYDVKYIGHVGQSVGDVISGCSDMADIIIKNYVDIDWNDSFDTIILGHVKELSNLVNVDFISFFLDHALEYNKQVISFDAINNYYEERLFDRKIKYYHPAVSNKDIPFNYFGKLRKIGKPIIAIVGTGPRQGKFTLQMMLKSIFENSEYSVGMLGTEPTSLLLGADEVYPMGYNSSVDVVGTDAIKVINQMMGRIEDKEPDLIIVGSQSQSVPFTDSSIKYLPIAQHEFLLASVPDIYVLCINLSDNIDYIRRTMLYLESLYGAKVLALAALPFDHAQKWSVMSNKKIKLSEDEVKERMNFIKQELAIKIYNISIEEDIVRLAETIVDYFS